ncbi:Amidase 1 [Diplonema papillatum]|nr:Amidase 1 [Diplonema papillatum]
MTTSKVARHVVESGRNVAFTCLKPGHLPAGHGRLEGYRLGVKDLYDVAGLPTSAGNPDWLNSHPVPKETNAAVEKLVAAGAEFVGKSLTDELAFSLHGCNYHYGTPVNAVTPDRLPGGSSSGSAVLVGTGEVDIGLGTDTGGSVRVPASYNGIFGIRTTHGAIPMDNMVALAPRFDTIGWFCRDAALLKAVGDQLLSGLPGPGEAKPRLIFPTRVWREVGYGKLVEEYWRKWAETWPVEEKEGPSVADLEAASAAFKTLQGRQVWSVHGAWITDARPTFGADVQSRFSAAEAATEAQEQAAEAAGAVANEWLERLFGEPPPGDTESYPVVLWPTTPGSAPLLTASGAALEAYRALLLGLTSPAGLAGCPQVHMPSAEAEDGGAVGISLIGRRNADRLHLNLAVRMSEQAQTKEYMSSPPTKRGSFFGHFPLF